MLAEQFGFLGRHCIGQGIEFGEDVSAVTNGKQFRQGSFTINGNRSESVNPASLSFPDSSQHFVCCIHYLEHFPDSDAALKEWWRVLAEGGILVLALPEAGRYPRVGHPNCNPDHKTDFTLESTKIHLESLGFDFSVIEEGFIEESFYLVVKKGTDVLREYNPPKYSVVIPYYKLQTMTAKCIDSVLSNCDPDEIICVNDGDRRVERSNVKHVKLGRNYGFPRAVNEGVKAAQNEFVVIINNDTLMYPNGLERLVAALRDPLVGMVGQDGGKLDEQFNHAGKVWDNPDYVEMFCCAVRKSVWERVGPLDEGMGRGYGEDSDWGIRARKMGYKLVTVPGCCEHLEAKTFNIIPDREKLIETNRLRLVERYYRGRALWVMASLGCNGGSKVVQKLAQAMQEDGWIVDVCSFVPWNTAAAGWESFGHMDMQSVSDHRYDVVISTFVSTMPFARQVPCQHRFALIQSDEPEWKEGGNQVAKENFMLNGFRHIIIADHMQGFAKKYGMDIIGCIRNGVDSLVFHPTWMMHRDWPHKIMVVGKSTHVWFDGQEYFEQAIPELAKKYRDLEVLVLGSSEPKLPCKVTNIKTYDPVEICGMYNSVSCVVIPSLIEGDSLVKYEAHASGCPVVTTRIGVDYGVDGENVLFIPYKDSHAIVETVSRIFDDEKLRRHLYLNGLRIAHKRTWEAEQEEFLSIIYKEMKCQ